MSGRERRRFEVEPLVVGLGGAAHLLNTSEDKVRELLRAGADRGGAAPDVTGAEGDRDRGAEAVRDGERRPVQRARRTVVSGQELALRAQVEHLERQLEALRAAFARLAAQREVIEEAERVVDAEYDRLGEVGAL